MAFLSKLELKGTHPPIESTARVALAKGGTVVFCFFNK